MENGITLNGIIIPLDVNRFGRPMGIGIETDDFKQYIVQDGYRNEELISRLHQRIELIGAVIGLDSAGSCIIEIKKIIRHLPYNRKEGLYK